MRGRGVRPKPDKPTVAVIGAGPGGIAMGTALAAGDYEFAIFDRNDGFGGTWRKNTYPGAACDVPSHFYSFSFALNPWWSKTFANQPEILAYLEAVADDHGLRSHLIPNTSVSTLRWSDADDLWFVHTDDARTYQFDVVISAVGMLDVPNLPDIPGADSFRGRIFHSSAWDHSRSTAGERVASIGTGASAVQYVPAIARETEHLTVFQRTPIWVAPRPDEPFTPEQQQLFARHPEEARKLRNAACEQYEMADFAENARQTRDSTEMARKYLHRKIADPVLRAKLTPDYPVGCKRPLLSADWWPTFTLPNVTLETSPIVEFTTDGLRTADGAEHPADTVIYGTGFRAADYLSSLDVVGRGGARLREVWKDGAEAYLGTAIPGYPNLFTLYGPNTNGVTSIIHILEVQTAYVRQLLDSMSQRRLRSVEVRREVHTRYNAEIQAAMQGKVWLANCNNYYRHPSGKIVTQFPYSGMAFADLLRTVRLEDYHLSTADTTLTVI
ncbi:NAD(P)/FAD-dependent oxidoreductase [Mycolicibacter heraklionensis]|uniref:NAD(P)/FAD-dependent oxidoreductase n=1 Tax=Mycolicibacter heraklionensis TaxID=512402 RepID=A0A9X7WKP7_9MYCO|nr:NAD(P)/FAD-dependent oxidoreductase [Mycolicibacter heraklionensis]